MVSDKTGELEEAKAPPADRPPERALVDDELSDVRVRVYGNAAVLTAINKATFRGKDADSVIHYRRTTVWVKRNGRWQCVSFHGSRIMEPPKPG
jgi:ketosteroid isomerase-like protein